MAKNQENRTKHVFASDSRAIQATHGTLGNKYGRHPDKLSRHGPSIRAQRNPTLRNVHDVAIVMSLDELAPLRGRAPSS